MSVILILGLVVLVSVVGVLLLRPLLGAVAHSESLPATATTERDELKCGVWAQVPQLAYTSYPWARLIVSDEFLGISLPAMGDHRLLRGEVDRVEVKRGLTRLFWLVVVRAGARSARVCVRARDLPALRRALADHGWSTS
jgi:hypothetical protein